MASSEHGQGDPGGSGTYQLDPPPVERPQLPGEVVVKPNADLLIDAVAADLVLHAEACVREFGDFHLALSGGSTPEPLYKRLMYDPDYRRLPWRRTHLWIVDERCVPLDDDRSNYKMINETLVDHADIPVEQVHPIFPLADDAAALYEQTLQETLAWRERGQDRLDYVLLGMGGDGHTASLFPGAPALREATRLIVAVDDAPKPPPQRISMTFGLINAARFIAVLVSGAAKSEAIAQAADAAVSADALPIKHVSPLDGELRWYLDEDACRG